MNTLRQAVEAVKTGDIDTLRGLIERQHRSMLERLKSGDFDAVIGERLGADTASATAEPAVNGADTATGTPSLPPPPTLPASEPALEDDAPTASAQPGPGTFGAGAGGQKPLDEVILDYLVKKARDRGGAGAARTRKRG